MDKNKIIAIVLASIVLIGTFSIGAFAGNVQTGTDYSDYKYYQETIPFDYVTVNDYNNATYMLPASTASLTGGTTWATNITANNMPFYTFVTADALVGSGNIRRIQTSLNQLNPDLWGYARGTDKTQKVLNMEMRASDFFISKTYWSAYTMTQAFPFMSIQTDWGQPTVTISGFFDVLIRRPVDATGGEYFTILHVPFLKQAQPDTNNNVSLFITEQDYAQALSDFVDNSTVYNANDLADALDQNFVFFTNVTVEMEIPINTDVEAYQCIISRPYIRKQGFESGVSSNSSMFARYLNEEVAPYNIGGETKLNVMQTIVDNINAVLKLEILGNVTLGYIVWICVAIGALFGILKYFAGG